MIRRDYTFNAAARTITFAGDVTIEQLGVVTNLVYGVQIYNAMDPTKVGTLTGNVLSLTYDTSSMSNTNALQVFYGNSSQMLSVEIDDMFAVLRNIFNELVSPAHVDMALNRLRATALIESGTITTVTTVTTVGAVTAVDSYQGRLMAIGIDETAWAQCCRSRIT
jgi:hypothetical protein